MSIAPKPLATSPSVVPPFTYNSQPCEIKYIKAAEVFSRPFCYLLNLLAFLLNYHRRYLLLDLLLEVSIIGDDILIDVSSFFIILVYFNFVFFVQGFL